MTRVEVKNGNVDGALKRFKVQVAKSGIPSEVKKRKFAEKPGVKRRREKEENIANSRKHKKDRRD